MSVGRPIYDRDGLYFLTNASLIPIMPSRRDCADTSRIVGEIPDTAPFFSPFSLWKLYQAITLQLPCG